MSDDRWIEAATLQLTKRELFAGLAMAGLCANSFSIRLLTPATLTESAVVHADALIAALALSEGAEP